MGNTHKHVYWCSRHTVTVEQWQELRRLFGCDVGVTVDTDSFTNVANLAHRYRMSGADELVLVAPLGMVERLVRETGIKPLWCDGDGRGSEYRFKGFRRLAGVEMKFEEIERAG